MWKKDLKIATFGAIVKVVWQGRVASEHIECFSRKLRGINLELAALLPRSLSLDQWEVSSTLMVLRRSSSTCSSKRKRVCRLRMAGCSPRSLRVVQVLKENEPGVFSP